ncbi:MAG: sulfotransferase [Chloroflexota bacterium]|nr:sulfotransferase [Chloroflexota bacterium]
MPVCITGMHRSGTSMVAKVLRDSGLYIGSDADIMPAADENPEGFWENVKFVELNDELLARLGGGWDCPPPAACDWSSPALTALRPAARTLIAEFSDHERWGWKDPRTSFTLPFWQSLLGDMRIVVVLRNPLEVARSLRARNGFSYALGLTLWRLTYQRLIAAVPAADRVVTHYDAFFARPEVEYQRLVAGLGMAPRPDVSDAFRRDNTERLRHHRFTSDSLADGTVDATIHDLYQSLCREAEWTDTAGPVDFPRAGPSGRDLGAFDTIAAGIGGTNRLTIENGALRQALDEARRDYRRETTRRDREVNRLQAATAERLAIAETRVKAAHIYEDDMRQLLTSAHQQLTYRDSEVMATLGLVLARHSPGAPAAIYYRQLLERVKAAVVALLPAGAPVAVSSLGDDAMLKLDGRQAWHFPAKEEAGRDLAYVAADTDHLLSHLEVLRGQGAQYLVMPASSWSWAAQLPKLNDTIEAQYAIMTGHETVCKLYDLRERRTPPGRYADVRGRFGA